MCVSDLNKFKMYSIFNEICTIKNMRPNKEPKTNKNYDINDKVHFNNEDEMIRVEMK